MRVPTFLLVSLFCPEGHAVDGFLEGSPDSRGMPAPGATPPPEPFPRPTPPLPPACLGDDPGHIPDPGNCNAFFECRGGVAIRRMCPEKLVYNPATHARRFPCDYPDNVDCAIPPRPHPPRPRPPRPLPPRPLPPRPNGPFFPQRSQDRDPKKVYNFYTYVTNNW